MNIFQSLPFNPAKPATLSILKNERIRMFAVGLLPGQILPAHKTAFPAMLTVLRGEIIFRIGGEEINLKELDLFEIPVNREHDVLAVTEAVFSVVQDLRASQE